MSNEVPTQGRFSNTDFDSLTIRNCSEKPREALVGVSYQLLASEPGSVIKLTDAALTLSTESCKS